MTLRLRACCAATTLALVLASCSRPETSPAPPAIPGNVLASPTADCARRQAPAARLRFQDDFDGTALDTGVWDYRQEGVHDLSSGRGRAASDRSAVRVAGGLLRLSALADPAHPGFYLNGHVSTETSYTFREGVAAARIRFQRARGQHGAFWIQSPIAGRQGAGPAVNGAEIDVAEFFGEGYPHGGLSQFVHYLGDDGTWVKTGGLLSRGVFRLPRRERWWNSFHVFSVEWSPHRYVFRIDGRVTWCSSSGVSGVRQFLVLSLLSSDWELPALRPARLPQQMSVDWVRVWER